MLPDWIISLLNPENKAALIYWQQINAELLGPQGYDHWWEVWSLQQRCPPGHRVAYLNGLPQHMLGYVPISCP